MTTLFENFPWLLTFSRLGCAILEYRGQWRNNNHQYFHPEALSDKTKEEVIGPVIFREMVPPWQECKLHNIPVCHHLYHMEEKMWCTGEFFNKDHLYTMVLHNVHMSFLYGGSICINMGLFIEIGRVVFVALAGTLGLFLTGNPNGLNKAEKAEDTTNKLPSEFADDPGQTAAEQLGFHDRSPQNQSNNWKGTKAVSECARTALPRVTWRLARYQFSWPVITRDFALRKTRKRLHGDLSCCCCCCWSCYCCVF